MVLKFYEISIFLKQTNKFLILHLTQSVLLQKNLKATSEINIFVLYYKL